MNPPVGGLKNGASLSFFLWINTLMRIGSSDGQFLCYQHATLSVGMGIQSWSHPGWHIFTGANDVYRGATNRHKPPLKKSEGSQKFELPFLFLAYWGPNAIPDPLFIIDTVAFSFPVPARFGERGYGPWTVIGVIPQRVIDVGRRWFLLPSE